MEVAKSIKHAFQQSAKFFLAELLVLLLPLSD